MRFLFLLSFLFMGYTTMAQKSNYSNLFEKKGKIGIGTKDPDALLTVKGGIHAQEVVVDLKGAIAPDYVFEEYFLGISSSNPSYRRWSLKEVENYLAKFHHLPGIPSAKTMEKEGVDLAQQNLLLLEKIEELTLYLLEQQKELDSLKEKIEQLNN